jgi:MFS family permease
MAKLSDRFGRRGVNIADVLLFALGSRLVSLAPRASFATLLIGRAVQGLGAGGIFPVASAVIGDTFPAEKRGAARSWPW